MERLKSLFRIVVVSLVMLTLLGMAAGSASAQETAAGTPEALESAPGLGEAESSVSPTPEIPAQEQTGESETDTSLAPPSDSAKTSENEEVVEAAEPAGALIVHFVLDNQPLLLDECINIVLDVPDTSITFCDSDDGLDGTVTRTDLTPGNWVFNALNDNTGQASEIDAPGEIVIVDGGTLEITVTYQAPQLGTLTAKAVDSSGDPIIGEGDGVCFWFTSSDFQAFDAERCDSADGTIDGTVTFADVPAGIGYLAASRVPDGYVIPTGQDADVIVDSVTDVTVTLPQAGILIVHFELNGAPLLSGVCFVISNATIDRDPCDGTPDPADGVTTLANLSPGTYSFFVNPGIRYRAVDAPDSIDIAAGETTEFTVTFEYFRGALLTIRAVDEQGEPLIGTENNGEVCFAVDSETNSESFEPCDGDDGTVDGIVHVADLAPGATTVAALAYPQNYFAPRPARIEVAVDSANDTTVIFGVGALVSYTLCAIDTDGAAHTEIDVFADASPKVSAAKSGSSCELPSDFSVFLLASPTEDYDGYNLTTSRFPLSVRPDDYAITAGVHGDSVYTSSINQTFDAGRSYFIVVQYFIPNKVEPTYAPEPGLTPEAGLVGDLRIFALDCGGGETYLDRTRSNRTGSGTPIEPIGEAGPSFTTAGSNGNSCTATSASILLDGIPFTVEGGMSRLNIPASRTFTLTDVCSGWTTTFNAYAQATALITIVNPGVCSPDSSPTPTATPAPKPTNATVDVNELPNTGTGNESGGIGSLPLLLALFAIGGAITLLRRQRSS